MTRQNLKQFIEDTFLVEFDLEGIDSQTDLFQAGVIDSFGYLKLINLIKEVYKIEFTKEEILSNMITTLDGFVELIESRTTNSQFANEEII